MIERYTLKEMGDIWTLNSRFEFLKQVECAVAKVQGEMGLIPKEAAKEIVEKADFELERILEIEKETRHDIIAFVSAMAEKVGESGAYIHFGLTSSDVLDTALSLQVKAASKLVLEKAVGLEKALEEKAKRYKALVCTGRTHGMHAEPTTLGWKFTGFYVELVRARHDFENAITEFSRVKLSGAVGAYSFLGPDFEQQVGECLNLKPEVVATQVIPRDRHARVLFALATFGQALERLSVELRHLQRTEVGEVCEGFKAGQKGSSAMPHKKNPISSENLTGISRLLRSYALVGMENVALWHERDISHSSAERVAFPDAFIAAHYGLNRMTGVIENLFVDEERIQENLELSGGQLFSSHVLLEYVKKGWTRERAYKKVQSLSHSLKVGRASSETNLKSLLLADEETKALIEPSAIDEIFSGKRHIRFIESRMEQIYSGELK